jgi:hypothetical protein
MAGVSSEGLGREGRPVQAPAEQKRAPMGRIVTNLHQTCTRLLVNFERILDTLGALLDRLMRRSQQNPTRLIKSLEEELVYKGPVLVATLKLPASITVAADSVVVDVVWNASPSMRIIALQHKMPLASRLTLP